MVSRSVIALLLLALGLVTIARLRRPAAAQKHTDAQNLRARYQDDIAYMEELQKEHWERFNDDETD